MNPLISVIVPTYNRLDLISQCVDSILGQAYNPIELIIVDDGSTDETSDFLMKRYGSSLQLVKHFHTGLPAVVRNLGIEKARGEYIAFCDSDDYWLPHKLQTQIERLQKNNTNLVCSDAFLVGTEGERYLASYVRRYNDTIKELCWNNFIITSSVLLDRRLLDKRKFSETPSLRGYEDYVLWLSLVRWGKIDFIDEPLLYYRKHTKRLSAEYQKKDARKQLLVLSHSVTILRYPFLWIAKIIKSIYHLVK